MIQLLIHQADVAADRQDAIKKIAQALTDKQNPIPTREFSFFLKDIREQ